MKRPSAARRLLHGSAARVVGSSGFALLVGALERLDRRADGLLTVLTYHRVDDPERLPELDPALISATPAEFERQIAYLAPRRTFVSLDDVLEFRRGNRDLPRGAVMVTFDDAYRDFGEHAWPVLRSYGVPTALFVPTSYPGSPARAFWWDRLHAALTTTGWREPLDTPAGRLPLTTLDDRLRAHRVLRDWVWRTAHDEAMATLEDVLGQLDQPPSAGHVHGWDELRALHREGVAMAAHTQTHPMLNRLPVDRARHEVLNSMTDLRRELGVSPPAFAFPAGGYTTELVATLRNDLEVAFTTERGINDLDNADWLRLRRVNVGRRSVPAVIEAQMLSWVARSPRARALMQHAA